MVNAPCQTALGPATGKIVARRVVQARSMQSILNKPHWRAGGRNGGLRALESVVLEETSETAWSVGRTSSSAIIVDIIVRGASGSILAKMGPAPSILLAAAFAALRS